MQGCSSTHTDTCLQQISFAASNEIRAKANGYKFLKFCGESDFVEKAKYKILYIFNAGQIQSEKVWQTNPPSQSQQWQNETTELLDK